MKNLIKTTLLATTFVAIQGCAPSSYKITAPVTSTNQYQVDNVTTHNLNFSDKRDTSTTPFNHGVLKADLILDNQPLAPVEFLQKNVLLELQARGLPASVLDTSDTEIRINKLNMRNHRTNAYTPFITFTMLSADIITPENTQRIGVYVKRGKVPVWSFDEIIEPTLNQPMDVLVKELSAKINRALYKQQLSNADVQTLISKIKANLDKDITYLDVYQLGFSNNPTAIDYLVELTKHDGEYIRLAAISSLGNMQSVAHFQLLKDLYENSKTWSDRAMALKAIGDLNTDQSRSFLAEAQTGLNKKNSKETLWTTELINLYL
ncbi:HEAT repeat domain-containing protein [Pseudoalteromonas sp. NEC-BIFX-2020_015]|uniref:HEAT repeat domain-containing protein n=1 Tax=Pseudoalteromonas sp. NEC-BIFX-2020_015 TaxID=2729544 RepID=UPI0014613DA3|nr:HEAT repeat domain-containing protein [Pseudoalteromonas sp. NEC-BIFX-2020_015]NMR25966.1 HEAT repeat domain-containing protein [Pseudoalteromonas sp. NEC-BIFX-2020_015]